LSTGFDSLPPDVLEWLETNGPLEEIAPRGGFIREYRVPERRCKGADPLGLSFNSLKIDVFMIRTQAPDLILREVTAWLRELANPPLDRMEMVR